MKLNREKINSEEKRRLGILRDAKRSAKHYGIVVAVLRNLVAYVRNGLHVGQHIPHEVRDAEEVLADIDKDCGIPWEPEEAQGRMYHKIQDDTSDKVSRSIEPGIRNYGRNP